MTIKLEGDEATTKRLIQIAQHHIKLALEHSKPNTLPDRRKAIKQDIQRLREERDTLFNVIGGEGYDNSR